MTRSTEVNLHQEEEESSLQRRAKQQVTAATDAEHSLEEFFLGAVDQFQQWNSDLIRLSQAIKEAQPKKNGAICLELYKCSAAGCRGCPHARWMKYVWTEATEKHPGGKFIGINIGAKGQDPIVLLDAQRRKTVGPLMRQAKTVLKHRANYLAAVRTLGSALRVSTVRR